VKDYWIEPEIKKVNKKKIVISIIIIIILIITLILSILYINNMEIRAWIDKNIFRKEVMQDNLATIELKEGENANIFAFNRYIGILNKNQFKIYGNTGKEEKQLAIEIASPLFDSSNRFLAIAENKGQKAYLIDDKDIVWETKVEGNISQIHVNKNGYVAIVITDTSYKSVISVYDTQGNEMFKRFLSLTRAVDVSISNDNKYLAIAEVDTSGTMIQSNVKIVSIEKSQTDPDSSVKNAYTGTENSLITKVKYQEKGKLICMYTDSIHMIYEDKDEVIYSQTDNQKMTFSSIELNNHVITVEERSSGLFTADSVVKIINTDNKNVSEYIADSVTKEVYTCDNILALNLGTEVEFINTGGWLIKRYIANQEITNITVASNIAGIIYRDKIEIINL